MLKTSNTQYPYEHYGDISVDFGSNYWTILVEKHLDSTKWTAKGFKFIVNNQGQFFFYIWATPLNQKVNSDGKMGIKLLKTNITWEEFSKSFVSLNTQAFLGRQSIDKFYEIED